MSLLKSIMLRVAFVIVAAWVTAPVASYAEEASLLWSKEFNDKISSMAFAPGSGDVIITLSNRELILYDRSGNERFHYGPRVDRWPHLPSISHDGSRFVFATAYTQAYQHHKRTNATDSRVHFYERPGNVALWSAPSDARPLVSPDGSYLLLDTTWDARGITLADAEGQPYAMLNTVGESWYKPDVKFSSDGEYFAFVGIGPGPVRLFKRDGTVLWERDNEYGVVSITAHAEYVSMAYSGDGDSSYGGTVYDHEGNVFMNGLCYVADNAQRLALLLDHQTVIMSLPDKVEILKLPLAADDAEFSADGRYVLIGAEGVVHVYDLASDASWTVPIDQYNEYTMIRMTSDGMGFVVYQPYSDHDNRLLFYSLR